MQDPYGARECILWLKVSMRYEILNADWPVHIKTQQTTSVGLENRHASKEISGMRVN